MDNHGEKFNNKVVSCTNCFKSVSVPSRMVIYNFLTKNGTAVVGKIVKEVGLTQPTISHHLSEMKHSGLLRSKKIGKEVHYSVNEMCPHYNQVCVLHGLEFPQVTNA